MRLWYELRYKRASISFARARRFYYRFFRHCQLTPQLRLWRICPTWIYVPRGVAVTDRGPGHNVVLPKVDRLGSGVRVTCILQNSSRQNFFSMATQVNYDLGFFVQGGRGASWPTIPRPGGSRRCTRSFMVAWVTTLRGYDVCCHGNTMGKRLYSYLWNSAMVGLSH